MKNNWILQQDEDNWEVTSGNFDDYGYGEFHSVSIGDEIESEHNDDLQFGIVIGIIRDYVGRPCCYKVWRQYDDEDTGCYDYVQASRVSMHEPCGSSEWSLGRIGYEIVEDDDDAYFYNKETGDVIRW